MLGAADVFFCISLSLRDKIFIVIQKEQMLLNTLTILLQSDNIVMKSFLEKLGYLAVPIVVSQLRDADISNMQSIRDEVAVAIGSSYMKNMILKFGDPLETGK